MNRTTRIPLVWLAGVALLSGGCNVRFNTAPLFTSTKTITADHVAQSAVDVETHNGAIRIARSGRDEVEIVATVKAESQERADATTVDARRDEAGKLVIRVAWPDGQRRSRELCSLDISVPDATGLRLKSHNGELSSLGLAGAATLQTHNGEIRVQGHDGDIQARTHNGQIIVFHVTGALSAETRNGSIDVDRASARVEARTNNGAIDLSLSGDGTGPIVAESSNGAVTVEISEALKGRLTASTSNGTIQLIGIPSASVAQQQKNRVMLDLDGDEPVSTVQTHNGAITLRRHQP